MGSLCNWRCQDHASCKVPPSPADLLIKEDAFLGTFEDYDVDGSGYIEHRTENDALRRVGIVHVAALSDVKTARFMDGRSVRRLCLRGFPLFVPHFRLYEVVSLHRCVLAYKHPYAQGCDLS